MMSDHVSYFQPSVLQEDLNEGRPEVYSHTCTLSCRIQWHLEGNKMSMQLIEQENNQGLSSEHYFF